MRNEGTYLVDMTTTEPSLGKNHLPKGEGTGPSFMDAPVTGGDTGARDGILSILAGGEERTAKRVARCFPAWAPI